MTEPTKRCSRCGQEKPISAFPWQKLRYTDNGGLNNLAGPMSQCLECRNEVRRIRYYKHRAAGVPLHAQWRPRTAQTSNELD